MSPLNTQGGFEKLGTERSNTPASFSSPSPLSIRDNGMTIIADGGPRPAVEYVPDQSNPAIIANILLLSLTSIVFVHGLQGRPRTTWLYQRATQAQARSHAGSEGLRPRWGLSRLLNTSKSADELIAVGSTTPAACHTDGEGVFWPLDLLAEDIEDAQISRK